MMSKIIFYKICIKVLSSLSKQRRRGWRGRGLEGSVESEHAAREPLVPKSTPVPMVTAPPLVPRARTAFPAPTPCLPAHPPVRQTASRQVPITPQVVSKANLEDRRCCAEEEQARLKVDRYCAMIEALKAGVLHFRLLTCEGCSRACEDC